MGSCEGSERVNGSTLSFLLKSVVSAVQELAGEGRRAQPAGQPAG